MNEGSGLGCGAGMECGGRLYTQEYLGTIVIHHKRVIVIGPTKPNKFVPSNDQEAGWTTIVFPWL